MFEFEMAVKRMNDRHEDLVQELQLARQLPRKARTNLFSNAIKAAFAPKATAPARTTPEHGNRRSLATK